MVLQKSSKSYDTDHLNLWLYRNDTNFSDRTFWFSAQHRVIIWRVCNYDCYKIDDFMFRRSFSDLQQCVVKVLQKCKEPTTGDFVESLFKLVVRSTPCLKLMNGSGILRPTTHLAALCVLSVFLIRIWPLAG